MAEHLDLPERAQSPLVVVIAGPNGAGKSTTAPDLLRDAFAVREFVNADTVARGLSEFHPESVSLVAGRIMLQRLRFLAAARESFAFETTLASRHFAFWLRELREEGFQTHVAFLSLPSADLAVARVADRVAREGHDVPVEVIRRRFAVGLANFFSLYVPMVDSWRFFDGAMTTLFKKDHGTPMGRLGDVPRILHAMNQGVRKALALHRATGHPVAVWRDGQVVWIPADEIPVELTTPLPELE